MQNVCIVSHIATFHKVNAAFEVIFDGERKIWKHRNILSISLLWEGNMERSGVGGGKGLEISANKETASEGFLKASYDGEKKWSRSRSTLDCLGTRLVPAHFWRQAQKVCTPHRLFRLGVIQRMEDILVFPVNHVFSILSNVIHTAWKFQKETVEFVCNLWWCLYLVLGKLKKELILFRNILGIFQCFPKKYFFVFISCKIWITFSAL